MGLILLIIVLVLVFGGGLYGHSTGSWGGPAGYGGVWGGGLGLGGILLIILVVLLLSGRL